MSVLFPKRKRGPMAGNEALERSLRREFARAIDAQRARTPSPSVIRLAAELNARAERQARAATIATWCETLLLAGAAAALALLLGEAAPTPPESAVAAAWQHTGLGLACLAGGFALRWARALGRAV